jgi:hypothetical protein
MFFRPPPLGLNMFLNVCSPETAWRQSNGNGFAPRPKVAGLKKSSRASIVDEIGYGYEMCLKCLIERVEIVGLSQQRETTFHKILTFVCSSPLTSNYKLA